MSVLAPPDTQDITMVRIVKDPQQRQLEIILASRALFLEQGYGKTTMADVMARLGIAKGTIYHYFKSKEQLLEAVVEQMAMEDIDYKRKTLAQSQGPALQRLVALVMARTPMHQDPSFLDRLHQQENSELHLRLLARLVLLEAPLYAEVIEQGNREGVFSVAHPRETAEFILAAVSFLTDQGLYPWPEENLMRRTAILPDLIVRQLGAPAGSMDFLLQAL